MYNLIQHIEAIVKINDRPIETIKWAGFPEILKIDWPKFKEKAQDIVIDPVNGVNLSPGFVVVGDNWFLRVTESIGPVPAELEFISIPETGKHSDIINIDIILDKRIPA